MKITISGESGEGKSTIAAIIAEELSRLGVRVDLVDDDDTSPRGLRRRMERIREMDADFRDTLSTIGVHIEVSNPWRKAKGPAT
jgi:Mrp family chromosome partitioning ATPase